MILFALGISEYKSALEDAGIFVDLNIVFRFRGPSFIQFIDQLPALNRRTEAPFVMPIIDKYRDMGTYVMGKVEAGVAKKGQSLLLMPNRVSLFLFSQFSCYHFYSNDFFFFFLSLDPSGCRPVFL